MSVVGKIAKRIPLLRGAEPRPTEPARLPEIEYNDAPEIERLVFVCGLHRSGTTLLERLLAARYALSYLRADVPESEGQHMQSVFEPAWDFGGPGRFAFSQPMEDALSARTDFAACRAQLLDEWSRFIVGDSPVLLEKSPPNLTKIWWLRKVFPEARFVIMARDPRAVSAATQKWSGTSLPELMMHWNVAYSKAVDDFSPEDCIQIRYEDLTQDPDGEISRLGSFLDLTPRENGGELEARHQTMRNSNDQYFAHHEGTRYGTGIWSAFGYDL